MLLLIKFTSIAETFPNNMKFDPFYSADRCGSGKPG